MQLGCTGRAVLQCFSSYQVCADDADSTLEVFFRSSSLRAQSSLESRVECWSSAKAKQHIAAPRLGCAVMDLCTPPSAVPSGPDF